MDPIIPSIIEDGKAFLQIVNKSVCANTGSDQVLVSGSETSDGSTGYFTQMGDAKFSWKVKTLDESLQAKVPWKEPEEKAEIKSLNKF